MHMSSIPKDLDQTDTAAVRRYILDWDNAHPDIAPPRDWYRSWELYLDQLRKYRFIRDYCDGEHAAGQYCLVCDGRREEATAGQWTSPNDRRGSV
jgi:hypothetical protein